MNIIQGMNTRVTSALNPQTTTTTAPPAQSASTAVQSLPRISNVPAKSDPILRGTRPLTDRREKLEARLDQFSKSIGQTPAPTTSNPSTPIALTRRLYHFILNKTLTQEQQQRLSKSYIVSTARTYALDILRSPLGVPFRQTLRRRSQGIILGSGHPGYDLSLLIHAIASVTNLVTYSIDEDPYGKVQGDVPSVIRTFTNTIRNLEALRGGLERHWTDVDTGKPRSGGQDGKKDGDDELEEVHLVLRAMKVGLSRMVDTFAKYGDVLGLDARELRTAREAARFEDNGKEGRKEGRTGAANGRTR